MMHLHRLHFGAHTHRSKDHSHTRLQNSSFDTTHRDCTNSTNLVHILKRQTKWLIHRSLRRMNCIQSLNQSRSLVPRHIRRTLQHIISVETRNRNERNTLLHLLITNLTQERSHLCLDLLVTTLTVVHRLIIHLVHTHDHLLHSQSVCQQSMLTSLTILRITSFELSSTSSNNQNSNISLRCSCNHILDEITMTRSINNRKEVLLSLELPQRNINSNTTLTLSLHLIQHPSVFERTLTNIVSFLLKTLNCTLINTSTSINQMTSSCRLS